LADAPDRSKRMHKAELPVPAQERRRQRLALSPCAACGGETRVVSRTEYVLYIRCDGCGTVESQPKPGGRRFGT